MQEKNEFHVGKQNNFVQTSSENSTKLANVTHFQMPVHSQRAGDGNDKTVSSSTVNQYLSPVGDGLYFRLPGIYFPIYKFDTICSSAKKYIKELLLHNRIVNLALQNRYWGVKYVE